MAQYVLECPRCWEITIVVETEEEWHPEVHSAEPEGIVEVDEDCGCWEDDNDGLWSWAADNMDQAKLVGPEPLLDRVTELLERD